jgi:2-oxoglutarate ferredoxin oxidoreductase subunit gamma
MKNKQIYRLIVAGEGGQGIQALAHIFAETAFAAGLNVAYMPNYGVEQRGGVSLGYLQFGKGNIGFPKFQTADILIVMCSRAVKRVEQYVGSDTLCIYDSSQISSDELKDIAAEKIAIPATETATKKLSPKVFNMILAGAMISEIDVLKRTEIESTFESFFGEKYKKHPELRNLNKKALILGEKLAKDSYAAIR